MSADYTEYDLMEAQDFVDMDWAERIQDIKVTEEMINAGHDAFDGYEEGYDNLGERLAAVFKAMLAKADL